MVSEAERECLHGADDWLGDRLPEMGRRFSTGELYWWWRCCYREVHLPVSRVPVCGLVGGTTSSGFPGCVVSGRRSVVVVA